MRMQVTAAMVVLVSLVTSSLTTSSASAAIVKPTGVTTIDATDNFGNGALIDEDIANFVQHPGAGVTAVINEASAQQDYNFGTTWLTFATTNSPVLVFDLGGSYKLTDLLSWGYNNDQSVGAMTVSFSTTGTGGAYSGDVSLTGLLERGVGGDAGRIPQSSVLSVGGVDANAVKFTITATQSATVDGSTALEFGFAEIRFVGEPVPEPNAALLAIFGLVGMVSMVRRRRISRA